MEYATPEEMFELSHGRRSDDPAWFDIASGELAPSDIVEILSPRITEARRERIERVLEHRTRTMTVVVEGMVDLGNVSAAMRTADGFGVMSFHTVDTAGAYKRSRRTTQGADKWLDRYRWVDIAACYEHLRTRGFTIVATDVGPNAVPIDAIDFTAPTAAVFGNELGGITEEARQDADATAVIPMAGFAESFNVSVAVAIVLHEAQRQRREAGQPVGDLADAERDRLRAVWYMKSVREAKLVIERAIADGYGAGATR